MNRRCIATGRLLRTGSTPLRNTYSESRTLLRNTACSKRRQRDYQSENSVRFSARYGRVSLNDTMLPGPKLQQDVFDVLLRFRSNPVALEADLTGMFSQVTIAKQHRRYHRFRPRGLDLSRPPEVYEAMRLMFGDRYLPVYLAKYVVR